MLSKQGGQSLVEAIIWSVVLILFFFSFPLLGKFFDVKHKHLEATRYAVWERTLWAPSGGDGLAISKTNTDIAQEIDGRVMGHPSKLFSSGDVSNPDWVHRGQRIVQNDGTENVASVLVDYEFTENPLDGTFNAISSQFAYAGVDSNIVTAIEVVDDALQILPGCSGVGINASEGLDLRADGMASVELTTPLYDRFGEQNRYEDGEDDSRLIRMRSAATILSDSWSTGTEDEFDRHVDGLVAREAVGCLAVPGVILAKLGSLGQNKALLGEALSADDVPLANDSRVQLRRFIE